MAELIRLALEDREVFRVLTPAERKLKESGRVKVALVARLSKEEEEEDAIKRQHSIEYQMRRNREFARERGYQIVAEAADKVSGKDFNRPDYQRLKERIATGKLKVDYLLFWTPDRFARDHIEGGLEERELREEYGVYVTFSEPFYSHIDTKDWVGRLRLAKELVDAEHERAKIILRTKEALDYLKATGHQLGAFPKHFRENPEGQITPTRKAYDACRMRLEGASWGEIRDALGFKSRREGRNIVAFVGRKASEVLAKGEPALAEA